MPHKKKRFFTKQNSTKFVLYTEGRDAEGNKIQENVLVPVGKDYTSGRSLLFSNISGFNSQSDDGKTEELAGVCSLKLSGKKNVAVSYEKDANLENILGQFEDDSESDVEECETLGGRMNTISKFPHSDIQIEVEEGSDFSNELGQFSDADSDFDFDEIHSKGCNYALTSSNRDFPESMKMLNDGFEKILEEYDDNQIGALDDEEICGIFSTENEQIQNLITIPFQKEEEGDELSTALKEKILRYSETEEAEKIIEICIKKPPEFDCESILSTYSNKYNHPVIIKQESKVRKIRIPDNPLRKSLTKTRLKQLDQIESGSESEEEPNDGISVTTSLYLRPKSETPEQRRERKSLLKEARRESRKLKKENKLAFKEERKRQESQAINAQHTRGIKLI